jgi:molecular chaperone DnaK (HSP70)
MGRHVVGIDLGTTNTVVASAPLEGGAIKVFAVPQLVAPSDVASGLRALSSAIYLPARDEVAPSSTTLPWGAPASFGEDASPYFLGAYAHAQGAKVPGRQIVSAKSWLSYAAVDRRARILPWGGLEDVPRLSPVEVSARILAHVRAAWDHAHPGEPLVEQDVVITIPASFDEIARTLTVEAAHKAGLMGVRIVEEPQAAFYDFLRRHEERLVDALDGVRLLLVVDVGGGTTDLTLVEVVREAGAPPRLERVAVGEHLMLGGDNMDATLARHVERELTGSVGSLTSAQWGQLTQAARMAKETLLSSTAPDEMGVSLVGRGARLIGGAKTYTLTRADAEHMLLDGFMPMTARDDVPEKRARTALTALSLPYAQETAVPRHVAQFLRRSTESAAQAGVRVYDGLPRPDAVLLNGGVWKSPKLVARFREVMSAWFDGDTPRFLVDEQNDADENALDHAVARGAAYAALVRHGRGVRIGSGSARAYFIGVTDEGGTERALCVAPKGMLEGSARTVDRTFRLMLGKPVSFPLFVADRADATGSVVAADDGMTRLPPIQTVLSMPDDVPVRLKAHLSDVGTLELSLEMLPEALSSWRLGFSTRLDEGEAQTSVRREALPARIDEAKDAIAAFFGARSTDVDPKLVKNLRRKLEGILGERETWSLAASRELFGVLIASPKSRRRSADHERIFFQLASWTLRPGFGAPLDDWRVSELFALFKEGVQHVKEKNNWAQFWLTWRRIAGGLSADDQRAIYADIAWHVLPQSLKTGAAPKGTKPEGRDEMMRLAASLERLPSDDKTVLGKAVFHMKKHDEIDSWWALGRIGAREPFRGSIHDVVPRATAEEWLKSMLQLKWADEEGASFAAAQLARMTGDRARDIDDELREKVWKKLESVSAPPAWVEMVKTHVPRSEEEDRAILGDSLPVGLQIA